MRRRRRRTSTSSCTTGSTRGCWCSSNRTTTSPTGCGRFSRRASNRPRRRWPPTGRTSRARRAPCAWCLPISPTRCLNWSTPRSCSRPRSHPPSTAAPPGTPCRSSPSHTATGRIRPPTRCSPCCAPPTSNASRSPCRSPTRASASPYTTSAAAPPCSAASASTSTSRTSWPSTKRAGSWRGHVTSWPPLGGTHSTPCSPTWPRLQAGWSDPWTIHSRGWATSQGLSMIRATASFILLVCCSAALHL